MFPNSSNTPTRKLLLTPLAHTIKIPIIQQLSSPLPNLLLDVHIIDTQLLPLPDIRSRVKLQRTPSSFLAYIRCAAYATHHLSHQQKTKPTIH